MTKRSLFLALAGLAVLLVSLVALGVRNYQWNVSALLHMDMAFGGTHRVPEGLVLYTDGGYDGMLYYQVARDLPALFSGEQTSLDSPYRFQRILLPLLAYAASFGQEMFFPYALLILNIAAVMGALMLMLLITKKLSVHALAAVLNPAAFVGVLYMLTEPLSLFFMMVFFLLWTRSGQRVTLLSLVPLFLSLLARETTIFLIGLLFLWSLWRRQWKQTLLLLLPVMLLFLWQYFLVVRLGSVAFQANGNILDLPFEGPLKTMKWAMEDEGIRRMYRLASLGLFAFVIAVLLRVGGEWLEQKRRIPALAFLLSGLTAVILMMDAHMWGAITSIGRVVTPLYPVYALYAAERDTRVMRGISLLLIAVSLVAAVGIASVRHPFEIS